MKARSLKGKIIFPTILLMLLGFLIVYLIIFSAFKNEIEKTVRQNAEEKCFEYSNKMVSLLDPSSFTTQTIANVIEQQIISGNTSREYLESELISVATTRQDLMALYAIFELNAYDNKDRQYTSTNYGSPVGRFAPYIVNNGTNSEPLYLVNELVEGVIGEYHYSTLKSSSSKYISSPYIFQIDNKDYYAVTIASPIIVNGNFSGGVFANILIDDLFKLFANAKIYETGYITIINDKDVVAFSPIEEQISKNINEVFDSELSSAIASIHKNSDIVSLEGKSIINGKIIDTYIAPINFGGYEGTWKIAVNIPKSEAHAGLNFVMFLSVITVFILVFIVSLVLYRIMGKTITSIKKVVEATEHMANGNLNVNINNNSNDEIGLLSQSIEKVRNVFHNLTSEVSSVTERFHNGDIDAKIDVSIFYGDYKLVADGINGTIKTLLDDNILFLDSVGKIGKGDFNVTMPQFPGKKAVINEHFEAVKNNIISVNSDISRLIQAALNGDLDAKIDTSLYGGDWKKLTESLNNLLATITEPINDTVSALSKLSHGNFDIHIKGNYKGKFNFLMQSIEKMVQSISMYISSIRDVLEDVSKGNLQNYINLKFEGEFSQLKDSINSIIKILSETMTDINASSKHVLISSKHVSENSGILAEGAIEQYTSIGILVSSIETIKNEIEINADNAVLAKNLTKTSIDNASIIHKEMQNMLEAMNAINKSSENISKIIKVIEEIAFQTNLLALNAAVEAARAGVHGKGFSIVAEEVRSLATRSQNSVRETAELIIGSVDNVKQGVKIANDTANTLDSVISKVNDVSELVTKMHESSKNQIVIINEIAENVNNISDIIQTNSNSTQENVSASKTLNEQAEILGKKVEYFSL